jgi:hypothetical protein
MERYMMILKSLKRMNPELEQALRDDVYPITVQKNEIFQIPFARKEHLYFIEKGLMRYYVKIKSKEYTMEFKQEDQFIIGLKNIDGAYQSEGLGIEALEESLLWCIPGDLVKELREKYPRFSSQCFLIFTRDHSEAAIAKHCTWPGGTMGNFDCLRKDFPDLIPRVPLHHLANFTQIPEWKLRHLLDSPIKLHGGATRRRRRRSKGAA